MFCFLEISIPICALAKFFIQIFTQDFSPEKWSFILFLFIFWILMNFFQTVWIKKCWHLHCNRADLWQQSFITNLYNNIVYTVSRSALNCKLFIICSYCSTIWRKKCTAFNWKRYQHEEKAHRDTNISIAQCVYWMARQLGKRRCDIISRLNIDSTQTCIKITHMPPMNNYSLRCSCCCWRCWRCCSFV